MRAIFTNLVTKQKEAVKVIRIFYNEERLALTLVTGDKALDTVEIYGLTYKASEKFIDDLYENGKLDLGIHYGIWGMNLAATDSARDEIVDYINKARETTRQANSPYSHLAPEDSELTEKLGTCDPAMMEIFRSK